MADERERGLHLTVRRLDQLRRFGTVLQQGPLLAQASRRILRGFNGAAGVGRWNSCRAPNKLLINNKIFFNQLNAGKHVSRKNLHHAPDHDSETGASTNKNL